MTQATSGLATPTRGKLTAVLGPTNTGKTHFAIDRMLGYGSGMIGLPLRLLAREVYDRVAAQKGEAAVALLTGEEKILPAGAQYFVCTVESMPVDKEVEFVAVDEIQLCADPERGHVFTDRLLHLRGLAETVFLGSDTMRGLIRALLPNISFIGRTRFSELTYSGVRKLNRLPRRSAIVAFSGEAVYGLGEVVRRQRGGAAVVMGALSPRTRNAQVELYQSGDVDFLVATDAIGMGLNMDVDHVALASLRKYDGTTVRPLRPHEIGQIAGRAGRYMRDGTFGTTGDASDLDADVIEQIESHRFDPVRVAQWRSRDLDFGSVDQLIESLETPAPVKGLARARAASDLTALRIMGAEPTIVETVGGEAELRRLWSICQIPDFRNITPEEHVSLLSSIYRHLVDNNGRLPEDWLKGHVDRLDKPEGDIDTLASRIAHIRTWTFVSNRSDWLADAAHWQERTRAVEDALSDALHEALTQRFVDRRTSVLMKSLHLKEDLVSEISSEGEVTVEGHYVGRLQGFRFVPDPRAGGVDGKALRAAAAKALRVMIAARADQVVAARDETIQLSDHGRLWWSGDPIARLTPGADGLSPRVTILSDNALEGAQFDAVQARLEKWLRDHLAKMLPSLMDLREAVTDKSNGTNGASGAVNGSEAAQEAAAETDTPIADDNQSSAEGGPAREVPAVTEASAEGAPEGGAGPDASLAPEAVPAPEGPPAPAVAAAPAPVAAQQMVGGVAPLAGLARGIGFQLIEGFGVLDRRPVADQVRELDQEGRAALRRFGVRFGQFSVFLPALLKPAQARLLVILWAVQNDIFATGDAEPQQAPPAPPPPGLCSVPAERQWPDAYFAAAGFRVCGQRAVRVDMLERLGDMIRAARSKPEPVKPAPKTPPVKTDAAPAEPPKPDIASDEAAVLEAPGAEAPGPDANAGEAPAADAVSGDAPVADGSAAEAPAGAAASTDAPENEAPAEEKAAEEPAAPVIRVPEGSFVITPDMMSIVGCSGEEFESILRALGYRKQTLTAEAEGVEPVEAWRPQGKRDGAPRHARGGPRRGPQKAGAQRDGAPAADRPGGGKPRRHQRSGDGPGAEGRSAPHGKAPQAKSGVRKGGPGGPKRGGHKDGPRKAPAQYQSSPPKRKDKAADPDSPFAVLAALKSGKD